MENTHINKTHIFVHSSLSMKSESSLCCLLLFAIATVSVDCNSEGDVLYSWRSVLSDPNNVLQSWDPTLVNPCTWFHITCNSDNSVTRVDLGNAELSGPLVPQLGMLTNLQYLEVFGNKISGSIPQSLGNITGLISLDLYENQLSGRIPTSLGNLRSLRYLRLNSNNLTGEIPKKVIQLIFKGNLLELNVSSNYLVGTVHNNAKIVTATITQDARVQ